MVLYFVRFFFSISNIINNVTKILQEGVDLCFHKLLSVLEKKERFFI